MAGFIQFMRCEATDELLRHPNSFTLLALIAQRARRDLPLINPYSLEIGEAMVGDPAAVGLTRQEFRTALANLQKWSLITIRSTNKGTIAKLSNSAIYDINPVACNQQPNQSATREQPENNQRTTTKNNVRMKEERMKEEENSLRSFSAPDVANALPEKKIESGENSALALIAPDDSSAHQGAQKLKAFRPPTEAQVLEYLVEKRPHNPVTQLQQLAERWLNFYTQNGFKVGKNPMKNWQASCRLWLQDIANLPAGSTSPQINTPLPPGRYGSTQQAQKPSQVSIRLEAIAGADEILKAMAAGRKFNDYYE